MLSARTMVRRVTADTGHCPPLTAHPEVFSLWDTYEPSSPPSCGVCLAPGAERGVAAGWWGWSSRGGRSRRYGTKCLGSCYPLPSQQLQQRIKRLVLRSVEETLRILLKFLALAKTQGYLILLALEVRWWA
jgi:hypothetical protein